jgi:hypothetical protein
MFILFNIIPKRTKRKFSLPYSHIFFERNKQGQAEKKKIQKNTKKIQKNTKYRNTTFKIKTKANK